MRTGSRPAAFLFLLVMLWLPWHTWGAQVLTASVRYQDPGYRIDFAVLLKARPQQVHRIITDHANLHRLSPTVLRSTVLGVDDAGTARVELILYPCVWVIFCKTLRKVTDAAVSAAGVEHVTVAELSDFETAHERLTVVAAEDHRYSRVVYAATLVPKFYVPPLIGPWVIRRQILADLETTADRVERRASERVTSHE